jgi:hypothetical protein
MCSTPRKSKRISPIHGGYEKHFPGKLHAMMTCVNKVGLQNTIAWIQNGRPFMVHNPKKLLDILPMFFEQTKYRPFQHPLIMWNFDYSLDGPDKGGFAHLCFFQGNKPMCAYMSLGGGHLFPTHLDGTAFYQQPRHTHLYRPRQLHRTPRTTRRSTSNQGKCIRTNYRQPQNLPTKARKPTHSISFCPPMPVCTFSFIHRTEGRAISQKWRFRLPASKTPLPLLVRPAVD